MSHDTAVATFEKLYADLADADVRVQRWSVILAKRQALPDTDPAKRPACRLAGLELGRRQVARARVLQKVKAAELAEAEGMLAAAQAPAVVAALAGEVQRLRVQLDMARKLAGSDGECQA